MEKTAALYLELLTIRRDELKTERLTHYFQNADLDDGWAFIELLIGKTPQRIVTLQQIKQLFLVFHPMPDWLFEASYQQSGDICETISLLTPNKGTDQPTFSEFQNETFSALPAMFVEARQTAIAAQWEVFSQPCNYLFNKLLTGTFKSPVQTPMLAAALKLAPYADEYRQLLADRFPQVAEKLYPAQAVLPAQNARMMKAVLMYVQQNMGASTQFSFALWRGAELVTVARFDQQLPVELRERIDDFVSRNTVEKIGPVRVISPLLVFEVAFAAVKPSKRHKAGFVLTETQIVRILNEHTPDMADSIEILLNGV